MNKSKVSKAEPLSKDLKVVIGTNLVVVVSMILFAAMGLGIAAAAASL